MSDNENLDYAVTIVAAYVANNPLPAADLSVLIEKTYATLERITQPPAPAVVVAPLVPAVSVKSSITDDYLICLHCGKLFKSLKRHIGSEHDQTPQEYRATWSLGEDYPMTAPAYSKARSALAKTLGLGRKPDAVTTVQ